MKIIFFVLLSSCAAMEPKVESDLRFCHSDEQCLIHRTSCGKIVTFNAKFLDYVKKEFDRRDKQSICREGGPDKLRHQALCKENTCSLISF